MWASTMVGMGDIVFQGYGTSGRRSLAVAVALVAAFAVLASGCRAGGGASDREGAGASPADDSPPATQSPEPQGATPTDRPAYWGALLDGVDRAGWESLGGDDATLLVETAEHGPITVAVSPGQGGVDLGASSPARVGDRDVVFGRLDGRPAAQFECAEGTLTFHGDEDEGAVEDAVDQFLEVAACSQ